jgi:carboxyl-terminal processing protease
MKYRQIFSLILLSGLLLVTTLSQAQSANFEISKNLDIYTTLLKELDKNYAEAINPAELTQTAIDAMLESLDPYTVYLPESKAEDFKLMTTGQYGGIGALIQKQGEWVVISEPYEGCPAQKADLRAGDRILEVNGESAKGKSSDEVSEILKGQPGVELKILIGREGDDKPILKTVVREEIKIPNIPYYGMLDDGIGYICLSNFTQNAGNEVKKALVDLKTNNELKGIILDLRGNGGGLLNEAVNICNLFVDKGQLIVSTKGKDLAKNKDHLTRYAPIDAGTPLAVLVDGNSASASEIVAGAIQDLDRGVIIGQRTFGKGLVQNIIPLTYNSQVKITVAKYYIPSGRCIQSIDYFHKDENGDSGKVPDSLITEFQTKNGRTVFDGGGIEPDVAMKADRLSKLAQTLILKNLVFDYANKFAREHATILPADQFTVTEEIFADLTAYLKDKEYSYKTTTEEALDRLKTSAEKENYFDAIQADYDEIKTKIMHDKQEDLITYKDEISEILKLEIVARYYFQKGRVVASLSTDPEIANAIEVLTGQSTYLAILDGSLKPEKQAEADVPEEE